jgi:hypothetical protein
MFFNRSFHSKILSLLSYECQIVSKAIIFILKGNSLPIVIRNNLHNPNTVLIFFSLPQAIEFNPFSLKITVYKEFRQLLCNA